MKAVLVSPYIHTQNDYHSGASVINFMMSVMLDNEVLVQYQLLKNFLKIKSLTYWAAFHTSLASEIPLSLIPCLSTSHTSVKVSTDRCQYIVVWVYEGVVLKVSLIEFIPLCP
jgi:hypothetical protein